MSAAKEIRDLMGRCSRLEQQVAKLPTRIGNSAGGSGGGTADRVWYVVQTYADLPDPSSVAITAMARIDNPDEEYSLQGAIFVINPEGDGWHSINFFV